MNFYVASCCTFCPPASYAFATLAYSPIVTVPSCWLCAVLICRPVHPHRPQPALGISVNIAVAAQCEWLRHSLPPNSPPGDPMHLNRRTLHDPSPLSFDAIQVAVYTALPVPVEPQVCANSPTMATQSSLLSMTGFPGVFAMTICARFLRSRSRPSNLFEPFLHTRNSNF